MDLLNTRRMPSTWLELCGSSHGDDDDDSDGDGNYDRDDIGDDGHDGDGHDGDYRHDDGDSCHDGDGHDDSLTIKTGPGSVRMVPFHFTC